jgi:ChrB-like protein
MLVYRLPRDPSTPRITLWRKLRRLGVAQVVDGVVALPLDSRNREQLEWLADEVVEAGGEATIWVSETATAAQERALAGAMAARVAAEYRAIAADAETAANASDVERRRTLARLRRELRRVGSRDYFPPPERDEAKAAVERLAQSAAEVAR